MRRTVFLATAVLAACNAGSNTSSLSLGARSSAASAQPAATASAPATALTRVRVAVQKIELRNRTNDTRAEIALGPVLINLTAADLSDGKVHRVLDSSIPAGTYDKIEFEIHPLERATNDAAADDLVNQHASAIIEGTFNGQPFTFVTALEAEQEFEGNFVVTDKSSNVTFDVDTTSWFVKDGVALDPRDAANRAAIEAKDMLKRERDSRDALRLQQEQFAAVLVPLVLLGCTVWVGLLALFNGINQIVLAFELKSAQHR